MKNKILAVDDSNMMLNILSGAIEMLDFEPVKARNGVESIEALERVGEKTALVLLDWNMPEMNGFDTLVKMKNDSRFNQIPVMMVTTESNPDNVIRAVRAGASHYLTKPFSQQDLTVRILECLGKGPTGGDI